MPSPTRVALEAVIVGVTFVLLFGIIHAIDMQHRGEKAMTHGALTCHAFLSGAIGHVLFESTGVNRWYAGHYRGQ